MAGKKAKPKKHIRKPNFEKLKPTAVLCPICRTILIEPVTLACDHAFCKQCFEGTMENANLVCPLCRLRVGSWYRKAKKENSVVNEVFWEAIQQQYPLEVRNKQQGIDNDIEEEKPVIIVANPGEIRKEYEKERQKDIEEQEKIREAEEKASAVLITKMNEEEEYKKQVEEERLRLDALLAKKLAEELSTPSTSKITPQRPTKPGYAKKYGPMDRFIRTENTISNRRVSDKKPEQMSKLYPIKSNRKPLSTSPKPKQYLGKEYTCHVLPVEQSPFRVNRTTNIFADLDIKSIFGTLGQKPTKTTDPDRRKSICTSGYKSSGSGDNSDVIDQECKFYFKPIDTHRRYHVPAKVPLKVLPMLGVNDGNVPIEPPAGKRLSVGNGISAFAKFSVDRSQLEQRAPSCDDIEEEGTSTLHLDSTVKKLKRKSTDKDNLTRKKSRKHIFATKNFIMELETKSITSPFYGFDNNLDLSQRVVGNSPFYGFNTLHIEESERKGDYFNRLISKYRSTVNDKHKKLQTIPYNKYLTYSQNRSKKTSECIGKPLEPYPKPNFSVNSVNVTKVIERKLSELKRSLDRRKIQQYKETDIDINRNIPKAHPNPFQHGHSSPDIAENCSEVLIRTNSISNGSVEINMDTGLPSIKACPRTENSNTTSREIRSVASNYLSLSEEGSFVINQNQSVPQYEVNSATNNQLYVNLGTNNPQMSSLNTIGNALPSSKLNKIELNMGTPPGILDSDSEDEVLSKLIGSICNPTELVTGSCTSPVNSCEMQVMSGIPKVNFGSRKRKDNSWPIRKSPQKIPTCKVAAENSLELNCRSQNVNKNSKMLVSDSKALNAMGKEKSSRKPERKNNGQVNVILPKRKKSSCKTVGTNAKITDAFSKIKDSPRVKTSIQKVKSSPQKTRTNNNLKLGLESHQINCDAELEQRRMQEEADFNLAKKLQAEFDLMSSRTRTVYRRNLNNLVNILVKKMGKKDVRQLWTKENMEAAIEAVNAKQMGWKLAARTFRVPRSTLKRRVLGRNKVMQQGKKRFFGGRVPVFTPEIELELVNHIQMMADRYFGLTLTDVRKLGFQLAEKLGIPHPSNKETQMAGWDWVNALIKRHRNLVSLRIPEATSLARAQGFNKPVVKRFFELLKVVVAENSLTPDQIYNMDESGFSTVQSKTEKILAVRGRKQVGSLTSAERGIHFSTVCYVNAMGNFIPPVLIFPRKNMKKELMDKAPIGSVGYANETGYMTGEICVKWLQHFKKYANPSPERKILLLMDGHSSHKSLQVLEYAKSNNIILFCLPAHCTHRLQPLDVSFYGPLTTYYNQSIRCWLRAHPGRALKHYQVGELFNEAFLKAATLGNAVNGFKKAGIVPLNEDIFPDWMFSPSDVTNIDMVEENSATDPIESPIAPFEDCVPSTSESLNSDLEKTAIPSASKSLMRDSGKEAHLMSSKSLKSEAQFSK